jgi:hypothetical protein
MARRSNAGSSHIVITSGQIDAIVAGFTRTWQRPPTEEELKVQLDEHVREEIATREALALGLDRDDTIIRRRLRQKLEFMAEDAIDATPPIDADLQSWLDAHPDTFRLEPGRLPPGALSLSFVAPRRRRRAAFVNSSQSGPILCNDRRRLVMLPSNVPRRHADVAPAVRRGFRAAIPRS